ncbi:MAG: PQQ-like beta-propeller repeat protein, partial [Phycisphaerales bacterium]|nr:PQQ-like beta-propeller repeat protein [Phycisphaerales bacterium]
LPPPFDNGSKEWGYGLDGSITADPVQLGRTAGFVTQTGEVFFVDIPTGSGLGRARISGGLATNPVTDGAFMYIASLDQSIYAFAPGDSTWLWRYRTDAPLTTQPAWHGGVLYAHVASEGLLAFDVGQDALNGGRFGEQLWANQAVEGEVVSIRDDELVVWDGANATLVDRVSGDIIARIALPRIKKLIPSEFADGDLYALADNGLLAKFSPR